MQNQEKEIQKDSGRIFKFRAWYQPDEDMGEVIELCEYTVKVRYKDNVIQDWVRPDFKLMQFTGLSDKNGKEAYEGDIYNCGYQYSDGTHKYGDYNIIKDIREFDPEDEYEIIGNIYENSELLKE